jgi:hypothetical protein
MDSWTGWRTATAAALLPERRRAAEVAVIEVAVEAAAVTEEAEVVVAVEAEPMRRRPNRLPVDRMESPC